MSKIYSIMVTEDQLHDMYTDCQIEAVNRNHRKAIRQEAQARKDLAHQQETAKLQHQLRATTRQAKHAFWMERVKKAVFFSVLSAGCSGAALAGVAWNVLFIPLGVAFGMYAAGITGGLLKERERL